MAGDIESEKTKKGAFTIYANLEMRNHVNQMREAGHVFGGRLISHGLLYELAYKIVVGIAEGEGDEMVLLQQKVKELEAEEAALIQKKKFMDEEIERVKLRQASQEQEKSHEWDDVRTLASRIVELWDKILLENRWNLIDSLVNISPERLTKDEVRAVFPIQSYQPAPDPSRAFQIAAGLLHYDYVPGMLEA